MTIMHVTTAMCVRENIISYNSIAKYNVDPIEVDENDITVWCFDEYIKSYTP